MASINKQDLGYLGEDFQYKLVHEFMDDTELFRDMSKIIDQNMFTNPNLKTYVGIMKDYLDKEEATPSYQMMEIILNNKSKTEADKLIASDTLNAVRNASSEGRDYVREMGFKFFMQQNLVKTANKVLKIAGDGDIDKYDSCIELFNEAIANGEHNDDPVGVMTNLDDTLSKDYRSVIPTGIGKLDEALEGGIGKGEIGSIICPTGVGKAQPLTSKVLTPTGFKTMGEINVGDYVIGYDNGPHKVLNVFPQGIRPVYKVNFSDGSVVECDINHLWTVSEYQDRLIENYSTKTVSLSEMKDNFIINADGNKIYNYYIPILNGINLNIDIKDDISLIEDIKEEYFYANVKTRLDILCHILDTTYSELLSSEIKFASSNEKLINNIRLMVKTLGGYSSISKEDDRLIISVNINDSHPVFITSITYDRDDYTKCILIDSEDHLYITDDFILTHNTSSTIGMSYYAATHKCEKNDYKGYKVLHIFFEDTVKAVKRKYIARLTEIEAKDLSKDEKIDEVKSKIESKQEEVAMISENVRLKRFHSGEKSILDIKAFVKKQISLGFKPDLLIIDYFECLNHDCFSSSLSEFEREGKTMRKIEAMAQEMDLAIWIPSQGTKDSAKCEDYVSLDKMSGSAKKSQAVHLAFSILKTPEDAQNNTCTIALLKNRAGISGAIWSGVYFNNGTCVINTEKVTDYQTPYTLNVKQQDDLAAYAANMLKAIGKNKSS